MDRITQCRALGFVSSTEQHAPQFHDGRSPADETQSSPKSTATPARCKSPNPMEGVLALLQGQEREQYLGRKPRRGADFAPGLEELRELRSFEDHNPP